MWVRRREGERESVCVRAVCGWVEVDVGGGRCVPTRKKIRALTSIVVRAPSAPPAPSACMRRLLRRTRVEAKFVQRGAPGVCAPAQRIMCAPTHTNERRGRARSARRRQGAGSRTWETRRRRWPHWGEGALARPSSGAPLLRLSSCLASLIIWGASQMLLNKGASLSTRVLLSQQGCFSPGVLLRVLLSFFFERDSVIMDEHSQ
jgi:hypothetical protein